ncbi:MAG: hypothetical protein M3Q56_03160 [Bacteroidota bacterium]|nr:hypothetical protein [Bacteroidota bacterium]
MLKYFIPINSHESRIYNENPNTHGLCIHDGHSSMPLKSDIIIFGDDPLLSAAFREKFYSLSFIAIPEFSIFDAGDFNTIDPKEKAKLIWQAIQNGSIPVVIGCQSDLMMQLSNMAEQNMEPHSLAFVSSHVDYGDHDFIKNDFLKEINHIGYQRHLLPAQAPKNHKISFLGEFRMQMPKVDAFTRSSDFTFFDLNAIRFSDSPGNIFKNPSGFSSEEACKLSRMIGSGDRTRCLFISEWDAENDIHDLTSFLTGQIVWYFSEGVQLNQTDKFPDREKLTQYLVPLKDSDLELIFYKSESSGKWWLKEPYVEDEFTGRLVPCTYEEYRQCVMEHIPDRILSLIYN